MSTPVTYQFLPWTRVGLATQLSTKDTLGNGVPGRELLDVAVKVTHRGTPIEVSRGIAVSGPGEVIGVDRRQVIRTDPKPSATDFEPNFLVSVEFDRPDFVWMFTPAAANAEQRLRPWIVLVVVPAADVRLESAPGDPLPVLTVPAAVLPSRQLPDLRESWAWAHAQVMITSGESLDDVLAERPDRTAARLVCPRRLDPDTGYLACVVPAFNAGRLAGLGEPPDEADVASLRPAWEPGSDAEVVLPVYYSWRFATGQGGDFESLARALRARPIPPEVGSHELFVGAAGEPIPTLAAQDASAVVMFRGALVPPEQPSTPWPAATHAQVQRGMRELLDVSARRLGAGGAPASEPPIVPPIYGRWLAARSTVPAAGTEPHWLRTLNLDPRHRATAGLATRVVQHEQERLMGEAWAQVGEIERANQALNWGRLAVEVRSSLVRRHAEPLPAGELLQVTRSAHRRLLLGQRTLWATARDSAVPDAALTSAFRRATRPRGPLARRAYAPNERVVRPIVAGLDRGTITAAPPERDPDGLFGFSTVKPARPDVAEGPRERISTAARLAAQGRPRVVTSTQVREVADTDAVVRSSTERLLRLVPRRPSPPSSPTRGPTRGPTRDPTRGPAPIVLPTRLPEVLTPAMAARVRSIAVEFKETAALAVEYADRVSGVAADPPRPDLEVGAIRGRVLTGLDPLHSILARLEARLAIPDRWRPTGPRPPLEDILATPLFPQPAWELLRDRFPEHLLPGLERVPANTVSLMQTNQAFVEAFLIGLNHEMGRELLWQEFPTDQRGTGFRRFWAPADQDDIAAIHTWEGVELGSSMLGGPQGHLVVLVRGDLLRRYPSTVIYAAPDAAGRPQLEDAAIKTPLFRGRLDPDVTFVGFDLTAADARSRWWFVFEEQPTEPRFAIDIADAFGAAARPLNQWNDLTWGHLAASPEDLAALPHIPVAGFTPTQPALPAPRWGASAATMAAILVQQPVRVAMRGADLLAGP